MRFLIAVLFSCLLALPAAATCRGGNLIEALAPEGRAELDRAVAEHVYPEGNFWRAEKPGSTVHVIGTVHIPDPRLAPLIERAAPLVAAADVLILEATSEDDARIQQLMTANPERAFLTEGPTLIDLLGDELWARVAPELEARGVPSFVGAKFQPWLLGMTLAIPLCALDDIVNGRPGLDGELEALATRGGTAIATLDDIEKVLGIFSEGTLEEQIEMVKVMLLLDYDQTDAIATTLDSYFAGRHRELWEFSRILSTGSGIDPAVFDEVEAALLDGRNRDWEPRIAELVAGRDAVIAVGAAHLSGETGVLRALERQGYALTRF